MGSRGQFYYRMGWVGNNGNGGSELLAKATFGAIIAVFVGGFWSGFYAHILATTGYDISSEEHIFLIIDNTTCNAFSGLPNSQQSADLCYQAYDDTQAYVTLSDLLSEVVPIISLTALIVALATSAAPNSPEAAVVALIIGLFISVLLSSGGYAIGFATLGGNATLPTTSTSTTSTTSTSTSSTSTTSTITTTTTMPRYSYCTHGSSPFNCTNPELTNGQLRLNLSLLRNKTLYDISLACSADIYEMPFLYQLYPLQSNGTVAQPGSTYGTTITINKSISVQNLPCNLTLSNGTLFNAVLWVYYLNNSPPASQYNPFNHDTPRVYYNVTTSSNEI